MNNINKRRKYLKKIGLGLLVNSFITVAIADMDLTPTVAESDKQGASIGQIVLGAGGVVALARTMATNAITPIGIYGGSVVAYYLIQKFRPTWFA